MSSTEPENTTAEAQSPETPRRTAVRRLFLDRLDEAGMIRPKTLTAEAFAKSREHLVETLAYLDDPGLAALAEVAIGLGAGRAKNEWPAEATLRNCAHAYLRPPPRDDRIVSSWLRSPRGPEARDGGWLVELYRWLATYRIPPNAYVGARLRDDAEDNRRDRASRRAAREAGTASGADIAWLDAYAADEADALDLVHDGEARRREEAGAA